MKGASILIVEDDEAIATGLSINLRLEGYLPDTIHDGADALTLLDEHAFDLVLLDISIPRKNGLDLLRELRQRGDVTPVVVLSAREGEYDKVAALRLGADDYVTKPFALAELMARLDAVLRRALGGVRAPRSEVDRRAFGEISVDLTTREVLRDGRGVKLTHLEFELLRFFLEHPSRVFERRDLFVRCGA